MSPRERALRRRGVHVVVLLVLLLVSGLSAAQVKPKLGEPQPIAPGLRMPANVHARDLAGARVGDGHVVAWADDSAIRVVRLDARGQLIDELPLTIAGSNGAANLMVASNGTDAIVGWTTGTDGVLSHRLAVLAGGSRHTITQRGISSLDGLLYDGQRYLALTGGPRDQPDVQELDERGLVVSSVALGIRDALGDSFDWHRRFFVDRGVAWLVMMIDGRATRIALTDANGKLQRPVLEPLPFELPSGHRLFSAGHVGGRWYVVHGAATSPCYVRFLDSAAPIAIHGFTEIAHRATGVAAGELFLFGITGQEQERTLRGIRVSPNRRVRSFDVASGGAWWNIGAVATPHGALLLSANVPPTYNRSPPAARMIRPLPRGDHTLVSPPVVLHWAPATQSEVTTAAHGAGFLAAWEQPGIEGPEIWSRLLDRSGNAAGDPQRIGRGSAVKLASNGEIALIVWSNGGAVEARHVHPSGKPIGEVLRLDRGLRMPSVLGAGWDGVQFSVAWTTIDAHVSTIALTAAGEILFPEPVRLGSFSRAAFAVSPFGALLVYNPPPKGGVRSVTMALRLGRDLRPAGAPFAIVEIDTFDHEVIWAGEHYLITVQHDDSLRGARVSASGESLDAPYGRWLAMGANEQHRAAYRNGRVIVITMSGTSGGIVMGGVTTDRDLRAPSTFYSEPFSLTLGAVAMRDDGAALVVGATSSYNWISGAVLRTIP